MVDHIEHQQVALQTPKMSKNRMKQQEDEHHSQRSFEEGKIIWKLEQIIETRTKQLRNQVIIEYLIKWKNLPTTYSTWEDNLFTQMHPQLPKR